MITKPENWKLSYCSGFLQGSAEGGDFSTVHRKALKEVSEWLIDYVGEVE